MLLKYNFEIDNSVLADKYTKFINEIYKLLPSREEGLDWEKPLATVLEELAGLSRLLQYEAYDRIFLTFMGKLEGLFVLTEDIHFALFRKTIFECLSLLGVLKNACQI